MTRPHFERAAIAYARRGWPVIPCQGKRALAPWRADAIPGATTDLDVIAGWAGQWPDANVAIVCGRGLLGRLLVLDVDGPTGARSLDELVAEHGPLPSTLRARTGGGGWHHYLRADFAPTTAGTLGAGLDTRGTGGYVLAPPSVHPDTGRAYAWVDPDQAVANAPQWLVDRLRTDTRPRAETPPHEHRTAGHEEQDPLKRIAASEYVPALTGQELTRGFVSCPFHGTDSEPSLRAYEDPDAGWTCYGCRRGGSIIDFGAELYELPTRGPSFHEIRRRLAADLLASGAIA